MYNKNIHRFRLLSKIQQYKAQLVHIENKQIKTKTTRVKQKKNDFKKR